MTKRTVLALVLPSTLLLIPSALLLIVGLASTSNAQAIRTSSPNGGEVWKENDVHDITWNAGKNNGDVKIYLETTVPGKEARTEYIATKPAAAGKLSWVVPHPGNEPMQARIVVQGEEINDHSDGPFTIIPERTLSVRSTKPRSNFALRGVFPNPASDATTFQWTPSDKYPVIVTLYNSNGTVVRTTSVNGNSYELRLDVQDLPQGSYFYELLTDGHLARGILTIKR